VIEVFERDGAARVWAGVREVLLFSALLGTIILLQIRSGAYLSSFASYPDEAAHFVTSLMVRDYIAQGLPGPPVRYAEQFYAHYPRVAFGIWPPVFHAGLGVWMVPWGGNRQSALAFEALIQALLCFLIYRMGRNVAAAPVAFGAAFLAALTPGMQGAASAVMVDSTVALFVAAGMMSYARYLRTESAKHAAWFGVFAAAAILTKYNGLALALVPPVAVVLTGRYELLRKRSFWLPLPIVILIAGPWYALMWDWIRYAMENGDQAIPGVAATTLAMMQGLLQGFGFVFAAAALAGAALHIWRRTRSAGTGRSSAMCVSAISTVLAFILFHGVLYRYVETRYLLPAVPGILILGLYALGHLQRLAVEKAPVRFEGKAHAVVAIAAGVIACVTTSSVSTKPGFDYVRVTDAVLTKTNKAERRVFVSSDASGEGAVVAEIAMRDQRPKNVVARASKLLAERKLMGNEYRLLYRTPEEVNNVLSAYGIQAVLVDDCARRECGQHHALVQQAVQQRERWKPVASVPMQSGGATTIYERQEGAPSAKRKPLTINMTYSLGRDIQLE
jgi:hypothetical protein